MTRMALTTEEARQVRIAVRRLKEAIRDVSNTVRLLGQAMTEAAGHVDALAELLEVEENPAC